MLLHHQHGRDIKQLLKLAGLVAANRGEKIQPSTIDFVAQFQPTRTLAGGAENGIVDNSD